VNPQIFNAEELGINTALRDVKCSTVDQVVRDSLGDLKKYFIHTLGHGVGRFIHEPPRIFYKSERSVFKEGMVITIEPGIYIKGKLGIRIEDTCLITSTGCLPLTKSRKDLIVIK
jgi:Xaa-Pro dipeptidase